MKNIYRFFAIIMLSLVTMTSKAQNDAISLTLLPYSSYKNLYNPAIPIESRGVFGFMMSNINFSVFNSSVKYDNLYSFSNGMPETLDINKFINSLDEHDNSINSSFSMDILRLGFKAGNLFVDFGWRMKYYGELSYSKDFLGFFAKGNGHYLGNDNPAHFNIGTEMNLYNEMAVGLQYQLNDKLSIGVRPKFLMGMANLSIDNNGTKIYTDENTYAMTADVNLNIKAATMLNMENVNRLSDIATYYDDLDTIVIDNIFNVTENIGFGIDFGASYVFNEHIGVAAGVYDLGYIKWKDSKERHNSREGVVINDALFDSFEDVMDMNIDITEMLGNLSGGIWDNDTINSGGSYKTSLKTRIMLQGYYEFSPLARFTAISQLYYVKEKFRPSLTLAYSGSLWRLLNVTANYTLSKYAGNSFGVGLGIKLGPLNVYAVTDNIMIASKLNASTFEMLTSYSTANIRVGMILTFGSKPKE